MSEQLDTLRYLNITNGQSEEQNNILGKIVGKLIKDVISSQETKAIADAIDSQGPRLFCFFDPSKQAEVADLYDMTDEEFLRGMEESRAELQEEPEDGVQPEGQLDNEDVMESMPLRESVHSRSVEAKDKTGLESQQELNAPGLSKEERLGLSSLQRNNSEEMAPSKTNRKTSANPSNLRASGVAINEESSRLEGTMGEEGSKSKNVPVASKRGEEEPVEMTDQLLELIARDEFKFVGHRTMVEALVQIMKEAAIGKIDLNEEEKKLVGSKEKGMSRLRTNNSIKYHPSHTSYSNNETKHN
jgi:hypothetical protein